MKSLDTDGVDQYGRGRSRAGCRYSASADVVDWRVQTLRRGHCFSSSMLRLAYRFSSGGSADYLRQRSHPKRSTPLELCLSLIQTFPLKFLFVVCGVRCAVLDAFCASWLLSVVFHLRQLKLLRGQVAALSKALMHEAIKSKKDGQKTRQEVIKP